MIGQEIWSEGRNHPQPKCAGHGIVPVLGDLLELCRFVEHNARLGDDGAPDWGWHDPLVRAFKEEDAEFVLQLFDLRAQCWLAYIARLCSPPKMSCIGECDQ